MKNLKCFVFIFAIFSMSLNINLLKLKAQGKMDSLSYYQEPFYTVGTTNAVIIKSRPSKEFLIHHYIFRDDISYGIFYTGRDTAWARNFPPENINSPLGHNTKYYYYFEARDTNDDLISTSMIDSSIQDQVPPILNSCSFLPTDKNGWLNIYEFRIKYIFEDSSGIDSVFLYQRLKAENWGAEPIDSFGHYTKIDSSAYPNGIIKEGQFVVRTEKDGSYEFYLGSKDAAHDSLSCARKWILNGNKDEPILSSPSHCSIRIDTHKPFSEIKNLKKFYNQLNFDIEYKAHDTLGVTCEVASKLSSVSLHYYYYLKSNSKNALFYDEHIFNDSCHIDSVFKFEEKREGFYTFFLRTVDNASNWQQSNSVGIVLDISEPQIASFYLSDTTIVPTTEETKADAGWTNNNAVWACIDTLPDNLSGIDSIFFDGDIDSAHFDTLFCDSILIQLSNGEGNKNVSCKITDRANNFSTKKYYTIKLDTTRPHLNGLEFIDLDNIDHEFTDSLAIKVVPSLENTDSTVSKIALFVDENISPQEREDFWEELRDTLIYTFENVQCKSDTILLHLYAVLKDYAGNISNIVMDSILFIPELSIKDLILKDLDSNEIEPQSDKWTDNLTVYAIISEIMGCYGNKAKFEFSRDSKFSKIWELNYYDTELLTQISRRVKLPLDYLGHDGVNELKHVFVRLVATTLPDTSNIVTSSIILDNIPPEISKFVLFDKTEKDDVPSEFKAEIGWTNDTYIFAEVEISDNLSNCESLYFWGDVIDTTVYFNNLITLNLKSNEYKKNVVYVTALDSAGNWGDSSFTSSIDVADIMFDKSIPPSIKITPISENDSIKYVDILNIKLELNGSPLNENLSRIILWENLPNFQEYIVPSSFSGTMDIKYPLTTVGIHTINTLVVDSAGNHSKVNSYDFYVLPNVPNAYNLPNPFNPQEGETRIIVKTNRNTDIEIKILDIFGNLVKTINVTANGSEIREVNWNGKNGENILVSEGVYICLVKAGLKPEKFLIGVVKRNKKK